MASLSDMVVTLLVWQERRDSRNSSKSSLLLMSEGAKGQLG